MKKGFTLAEVLIVLGIIGVIAETTIPTLYNNFQKQVVVTRLQKAYTSLYQAIRLSENDNGEIAQWDFGTKNDANSALAWFNTYLAKYMRYTKATIATSADGLGVWPQAADVYLSDGTIITFWNNDGPQYHALVNIGGIKSGWVEGKTGFTFFIGSPPASGAIHYSSNFLNKEVRPYDYRDTDCAPSGDRNYWLCDAVYSCTKTGGKGNCTGLIMFDGWKISNDYPYFN